MRKILIIIFFCIIIISNKTYSQSDSLLTFSEIMFAPNSGESEFVEIYNTSTTDTIDLAGFQLKYLHTTNTDDIIAHNNGTKLNPQSFAIIFEDDYDFDSGIYNTLIPAEALIIKIDNGSFASGLSNSTARTLFLINSSGDTLDTYTYSTDNSRGYSDEKIILNKDNSDSNWANSLNENGTPGGDNSVTPVDYDLSVNSIGTSPAKIYAGGEILLTVEIENKGLLKSGAATIEIFDDYTWNNFPDAYEKFDTQNIDSLSPGGKITINSQLQNVNTRFYRIIAKVNLSNDENKNNDTLSTIVEVLPEPRKFNDIVINEIMYDPEDGEPEWIELYNRTTDQINISDWKISDKSSSADLPTIYISPKSFLVLSKDASIFDYYPNLKENTITVSLPSLNNSGDEITLSDHEGRKIDNVNYFSGWGGNTGGKSLERISADEESNSELNWGTSQSIYKATPGFINSITQKDFDLRITNFSTSPPIPFETAEFKINFTVKNIGINPADTFIVNIYSSSTSESLFNNNSKIYSNKFLNLASGDSLNISSKIDSLELRKYFIHSEIIFTKDNDTTNNKISIDFLPEKKPADFNDIVINELMYDPADDETEWVEIFNQSDREINLINWKFADRSSEVTITEDSLKLLSGEYLVLNEDNSINEFYEIPSRVISLKLPSLNNGGDDLYIYDKYGNVIDSLLFSSSWGGGNSFSLERINSFNESNNPANWGTAITKHKATPGKINSVTPKEFDLAIGKFYTEQSFVISPAQIKIAVEILNNGFRITENAKLNIYNNLNNSFTSEENEIIYSTNIPPIEPGKVDKYSFEYFDYAIGKNNLTAEIIFEDDQFVENNISFTNFNAVKINEVRNDIVINEFMSAPESGQPEWIEIYNRSEKHIDLRNYQIADDSDTAKVINNSTIINPGEYFLIIKDSSFFSKFETDSKFIVSSFPTLNNSSDKIILLDSLNRVIDSLQYFDDWNIETGKSLERISTEEESININNWSVSKDFNGGTPGKINSVTQKNYDVGITKILFNPGKPKYRDEVFISAFIKNYGKQTSDFSILLIENGNIIETSENINLLPSDSISHIFNFRINSLTQQRDFSTVINFEEDQDTTNNKLLTKLKPGYNYNSVIINEIMFTPQNGEPEWFEIYNTSNYEIDLSDWSVSDILTNPEEIILAEKKYFIEPKSFLVISKDSSIINFYDKIPSKILVTSFANLNNSEDGVVLKDVYKNIIDSVHYNSNWNSKTGYSIERISLDGNSNDLQNWSYSNDIEQATPGRRNSLSKKDYDISTERLFLSENKPKYNSYTFINCVIQNVGLNVADNFSIRFYINDKKNIWDEVFVNSLLKDDSLLIQSSKEFIINSETNIFAEVHYSIDEDTTNNFSQTKIILGYYFSDIIINEIMANPNSDEPEWIEFLNNSNHEIDLKDFSASDYLPSPQKEIITKTNYIIHPNEYFIITSDSLSFAKKYLSEIKIIENDFGTLGNTEDGIFIYDSYNTIIDSVIYNSDWDITKGYSIERLSKNNSAQDLNNWVSSINSNGSTPGFNNSVSESKSYKFNQVVINEIMFEPGENNSEFIEFYNTSDEYIQIGGWVLENEKDESFRIFNSQFVLEPGSYFVTSADSLIIDFYDLANENISLNILNETDLGFVNTEQLLILKDLKENIIDSLRYNSKWHNPNIIETRNVSLERLSPNINSNESSNWSSSANINGATPGKRNSIFTDNKITEAGLTISPNPFSPDNDGFEDFCTINYDLPISLSQIRIKIFDDRGRLVRTLADNQASGSKGSIIFDGLKENKSPLRIGMYIVYFEATNAQTGQQEILKDVVVIARKL